MEDNKEKLDNLGPGDGFLMNIKEMVQKRYSVGRAVVAHAFNPSTWEAEAGGFL